MSEYVNMYDRDIDEGNECSHGDGGMHNFLRWLGPLHTPRPNPPSEKELGELLGTGLKAATA